MRWAALLILLCPAHALGQVSLPMAPTVPAALPQPLESQVLNALLSEIVMLRLELSDERERARSMEASIKLLLDLNGIPRESCCEPSTNGPNGRKGAKAP